MLLAGITSRQGMSGYVSHYAPAKLTNWGCFLEKSYNSSGLKQGKTQWLPKRGPVDLHSFSGLAIFWQLPHDGWLQGYSTYIQHPYVNID